MTAPASTANTSLQGEPCLIVIFGASGDLAHRKLFPALLNLAWERHLHENTVLLGVSRQPVDEATFRAGILRAFGNFAKDSPTDDAFRKKFVERIFTFAEDSEQMGPFIELPNVLKRFGEIDILLCHQPPHGILDKVTAKFAPKHWKGKHAGSKTILDYIQKYHPKYVFCGHIHEGEGMRKIGASEVYNLGVCGYKLVKL